MVMEKITYFERSGPVNTPEVLRLAFERAKSRNITKIVIPSRTGDAIHQALSIRTDKETEIIGVSSPIGSGLQLHLLEKWGTFNEIPELSQYLKDWKSENLQRIPMNIPEETATVLREKGATVVYGRTAWMKSPFTSKVNFPNIHTIGQAIILALRLLGTGIEVAVKAALIACEEKAVNGDEEIISTGGIERGLDTAIVLRPSVPEHLFDEMHGMDIREIICKPRSSEGSSGRLLERISPL